MKAELKLNEHVRGNENEKGIERKCVVVIVDEREFNCGHDDGDEDEDMLNMSISSVLVKMMMFERMCGV